MNRIRRTVRFRPRAFLFSTSLFRSTWILARALPRVKNRGELNNNSRHALRYLILSFTIYRLTLARSFLTSDESCETAPGTITVRNRGYRGRSRCNDLYVWIHAEKIETFLCRLARGRAFPRALLSNGVLAVPPRRHGVAPCARYLAYLDVKA